MKAINSIITLVCALILIAVVSVVATFFLSIFLPEQVKNAMEIFRLNIPIS